uniref:Uncharacterized protein n=1 Tax=Kalanchoe fedtschenkoi TaxID=63787 RepID=A0A7N0SWM4_KALFE
MADKRVEFSHHPENPRSSNDVIKHGNYFESPILRRGVTLTHGQYQEFSSYPTHAEAADPHTSGSHDFYNTPLHHLDCSCFQC